jgi:chromosome segregation ATPase
VSQQLSAVASEVQRLTEERDALLQRVDAAGTDIKRLTAELDASVRQQGVVDATNCRLTSEVASANARVTGLEAEVKRVTSELSTMQERQKSTSELLAGERERAAHAESDREALRLAVVANAQRELGLQQSQQRLKAALQRFLAATAAVQPDAWFRLSGEVEALRAGLQEAEAAGVVPK